MHDIKFYEKINQKSSLDFLIGVSISLERASYLKPDQAIRKQAFFNLIENKFDWKYYTNYWLDLENKISAATLSEPLITFAQINGCQVIIDDSQKSLCYLVLVALNFFF